MPGKHSIDELITHYDSQGLLAYPDLVQRFGPRVEAIPMKLSLKGIQRNLALLLAWPLVERYQLLAASITRDLNQTDKRKLVELEGKMNDLKESEDIAMMLNVLDVPEQEMSLDIKFLNPYNLSIPELARYVFALECVPLKDHERNTTKSHAKVFHDAQMGGSLYIQGFDKQSPPVMGFPYSFLERCFVSVDHKGEPFLFIDSIEGGDDFMSRLDHWRGFEEKGDERPFQNRVYHVYFALAAAMSVASHLDLRRIVPRDYELVELSRNLGLRERRMFAQDQTELKIGLHSQKKHSGVYLHTLNRVGGGPDAKRESGQYRHRALDLFPLRSSGDMYTEMERLSAEIIRSNKGRERLYPKTQQRLDALVGLYQLMDAFLLTPPERLERAQGLLSHCISKIPGNLSLDQLYAG